MAGKTVKRFISVAVLMLIPQEATQKENYYLEKLFKPIPRFFGKTYIQQYLADYLRTYLTSIDNSRIYGKKMGIKKEVKASYEQFIKENQISKYHNIVKEYYKMVKKNGFVIPKNHVAFLGKNGFKTLLGKQAPTY